MLKNKIIYLVGALICVASVFGSFAESDIKYFKLPITLLHAYEDKCSMGNGSIEEMANIVVKGDQATLYIGSKIMTIADIKTSLIDIYYDDGQKFLRAKGHAYSLALDDSVTKRPRVFSIPTTLDDKPLTVMVDPKIGPMGDDPIKARLKLEFEAAEEIEKQEATLVLLAESGANAPVFKADEPIQKMDKSIEIKAQAGVFIEPFIFYANTLTGEELIDFRQQHVDQIKPLSTVDVYTIEAAGVLDAIPHNVNTSIKSLRTPIVPMGEFEVSIPLPDANKKYQVYAALEKLSKLDAAVADGCVQFTYDRFVPFVLISCDNTKSENLPEVLNQTLSGDDTQTGATNTVQCESPLKTELKAPMTAYPVQENMWIIVISITVITAVLVMSWIAIFRNMRVIHYELNYSQLKHSDKK